MKFGKDKVFYKRLVILTVVTALCLTSFSVNSVKSKDLTILDDSFLYQELTPADKSSIDSFKPSFTIETSISDGADYLVHAQADITEDNAGNGNNGNPDSPDDPDDGGWDWRLTDPNYTHTVNPSPKNIYGATAQGLYYAYLIDPDPSYMTAMTDAANYMAGDSNIRSAADLIFLMNYNDLPGVSGTAYKDAAKAKYDDRISAYGSATALAEYIRDARNSQGYPNGIIAWDIGAWVVAAAMLDERFPSNGYDLDADAMAEVLYQDSFNDNPGYFDIVDDQGYDSGYGNVNFWWYPLGISGLIDAFDAAQVHISEIPGLLSILLNCQCACGAFSFQYGGNTGDEDWQASAYAVMTLGKYDPYTYHDNIVSACSWIASTQDVASGGWVYSSGNHYPEVGGENTAALYFAGSVINIDTSEVFWTIQSAVDNADPCNTIIVLPGLYVEQVFINKDLTLQGLPGAIIQAPSTMTGYTIPESTHTFYPVVFADGGSGIISVEVKGFEIDGADNVGSYDYHVGILYRNVQPGTHLSRIADNVIHSMGTNGQQTFGILIYGDSDVLVEDNTISEFSRGGIGVLGDAGMVPDPVVSIDENIVTGPYDPSGSPTWASNGIQISYGASGSITSNDVSACGWPGTAWAGTGILVGDTSDVLIDNNHVHDCEQAIGVGDYPAAWGYPFNVLTASDIDVTFNTLTDNEWGISVFNDITNALIQCNEILDTLYDGIDVYNYGYGDNSPTNIEIHYNDIVGSGADGLWVGPLVTQTVDAECNWWGDHSGPGGDGPGTGDTVVGNADYDPWIFVDADAGGPYVSGGVIHFDASGTNGSCGALSYHWDFGDGTTGAGVNPMKTYSLPGTYTVKLTVTLTTVCGRTYTDTDTTTATLAGGDPPIIELIYPTGGEILSGVVTVKWYAIDEDFPGEQNKLPIYMFYSADGGNSWRQIDDVLENDGEYDLDTTEFADGEYMIKVEAIHDGVAVDTSDPFTIDNGYTGVKISDVRITDTSISSYQWVKNGDDIEVSAGITSSYSLKREDISADLSGFGLSDTVIPNSFDGFTAKWIVHNVVCNPSDGEINVPVTVNAAETHTKIGKITADNTKPEIEITKPANGLYFLNRKFFPLPKTIVIGKITIEADGLDTNGIAKMEFYVDGELRATLTEEPFSWYMKQGLMGNHEITIKAYDPVGNIATQTQQARFFSLFL